MRPGQSGVRPTRFGFAFLVLILLTFVGCINYQLSLGYGLTFLLLGAWMLSGLHLDRLTRLGRGELRASAPVMAGEQAKFSLIVTGFPDGVPLRTTAHSSQGDQRTVHGRASREPLPVLLPARTRGHLGIERGSLVVLDAFGMWQASRPLSLPTPVTVTPEPLFHPLDARFTVHTQEGRARTAGTDEFAGLRPYQAGDAPRQVSWRHAARTGQLLTRETDAPAGTARTLDWADTRGSTETRVSVLAGWVQQAARDGQPFALRLPGHVGRVGVGAAHVQASLAALAHLRPLPTTGAPMQAAAETASVESGDAAWLLTLSAVAFALAPLLLRQPLLLSVVTFGLLAYTGQRRTRTLPAPGLPVLVTLVALGGALLQSINGSLLGVASGTAILGLLIALKAAESRSSRDARLLLLLGLFQTSTHFFAGQGPLTALHAVLAAVSLLGAATAWTAPLPRESSGIPIRTALAPAWRAMLLAVPVAALLFILFPRPDGPLWRIPLSAGATTGLASEITAGEYGALAQSNAVAFRADFGGRPPLPEERYWRGPVYEAFDGRRWTQVRFPGRSPSLRVTGPVTSYTITLEPNGTSWLPSLDTPVEVPPGAVLTTAFQAATRPSGARSRFRLGSAPARRGLLEDPERLTLNLSFPAGANPRATRLAQTWAALPAPERVQAALQFLRAGGFTYTLNPPTLPEQDRVDAFLFGSRQGFCEHYASAFTFLMRVAGVPTRIVGGYLGGQVNPDGQYLIVRQRDAHAWTEVWLTGQGWVRVDPTAVIAPARLNADVGTALTSPQASARPAPGFLGRLQLRLDALQNAWNERVVGYDGAQQRSVLSALGVQGAVQQAGLLILGAGALVVVALLLMQRQDRPRDALQRAVLTLTRRTGVPIGAGETISDYVDRVGALHPEWLPSLLQVRDLYHAARYAPRPDPAALTDLHRAVRAVR